MKSSRRICDGNLKTNKQQQHQKHLANKIEASVNSKKNKKFHKKRKQSSEQDFACQ